MKLNWFSPVPPTPSSIAIDTAAVLPSLAKHAAVTLWVTETSWSPDLEKHARVRHYDPAEMPWADINQADATIYHIGNYPEYHGPIWKVNQQHPGIVVLHDLNLQHLFLGMVHRGLGLTADEYREMMIFYHPDGGDELAEKLLCRDHTADEAAEHCPLMGAALENALAVGVHTRSGCSLVQGCSDLPVAYIPLFASNQGSGVPVGAVSPVLTAEPKVHRIIMFGFLGTNRRIEAVLAALRHLPDRHRFRLDVYGTVSQEATVRSLIESYALAESVTLHGFVSPSELAAALSRSDLAVNLRNPTMGEASASQLQIWQNGLPSLVSDTGWYATLPDDTVALVRPNAEVEDIQNHLRSFLDDPGPYQELGRNGRRYLAEHHTLEAYVRGVLDLVASATMAKGLHAARWMSGRIGRTIRPWFAQEAAGVMLPRLALTIRDVFNEPAPEAVSANRHDPHRKRGGIQAAD